MPAVLPALALVQYTLHSSPLFRSRLMVLAFLVAAYLGLVLLDLIRGPLALKSMRPSSATAPRMLPIGPGESLPADAGRFLTQARTALEGIGFNHLALLRPEGGAGYISLATDAAGTVATALALSGQKGGLVSLVGFTTRLVSGARVSTGNSTQGNAWPARPGDDVIQLPEADLLRLHAMHRARVAKRVAKGARIAPVSISDPAAYQSEQERESVERAVASGYFVRDGAQKRHSWKGACLNAWRRSHPFRELREWMIARSHRALLREIGVSA